MGFFKGLFSGGSPKCSTCGTRLIVLPEEEIRQLGMSGSAKVKKVANHCEACGEVFCTVCGFKTGVEQLGIRSLACPKCHSTTIMPLQ